MKEILEPERVKFLRKKKGFTGKQLAALLQISRSYLSKIENGTCSLSLKMAARIVLVLDCSLNDLYKSPSM